MMVDVLLDGHPMTRVALVQALERRFPGYLRRRQELGKGPLPPWMEFDVCEGMVQRTANGIAKWCLERKLNVWVRRPDGTLTVPARFRGEFRPPVPYETEVVLGG